MLRQTQSKFTFRIKDGKREQEIVKDLVHPLPVEDQHGEAVADEPNDPDDL